MRRNGGRRAWDRCRGEGSKRVRLGRPLLTSYRPAGCPGQAWVIFRCRQTCTMAPCTTWCACGPLVLCELPQWKLPSSEMLFMLPPLILITVDSLQILKHWDNFFLANSCSEHVRLHRRAGLPFLPKLPYEMKWTERDSKFYHCRLYFNNLWWALATI